jgi:precorrin-2/cobalt-factor-2 C20-methyltransferase
MGARPVSAPAGTLYGVGVGPGDPELMTLKAARLIRAARVVAYPAPGGEASLARSVAAELIARDAVEIPMRVPMRLDRAPAQDAYAEAARAIAAHLAAGTDVVVLCEGDPFFYGSFMYLHARLSARYPAEIVPGVSSLGACAAALGRPLVARNCVLSVLPGPLPDAELGPRIEAADAVAIMKVGRHMPRLKALVGALGLTPRAAYVERASLPQARACALAEAPDEAPYFSTILISRTEDPWLRSSA